MIALALRYWWAIAIAALCLAVAGQQVRISAAHESMAVERHARATETAARERAAREQESANNRTALARFTQAQEAANAARTRETSLLAAAAGSRTELDRLRIAIHAATAQQRHVSGSATSPDAQPASAIGELFGACAAEVQELARLADRHASDVQTLIESWPK